jgi:hypothetical protein
MAFTLSEQTKIESNIGFVIGILVGAFAAWMFILFFTPWQWYFKVFSSIGSIGILGSLSLSLMELIKVRRNYLDAKAEMEKINKQANNTIETSDSMHKFLEENE